jgi:hypothetical protein
MNLAGYDGNVEAAVAEALASQEKPFQIVIIGFWV